MRELVDRVLTPPIVIALLLILALARIVAVKTADVTKPKGTPVVCEEYSGKMYPDVRLEYAVLIFSASEYRRLSEQVIVI